MNQHCTYIPPISRQLSLSLEKYFCYSNSEPGSTHGGPEDIGYDNWLDGLE